MEFRHFQNRLPRGVPRISHHLLGKPPQVAFHLFQGWGELPLIVGRLRHAHANNHGVGRVGGELHRVAGRIAPAPLFHDPCFRVRFTHAPFFPPPSCG